jgi:PKD repeat protein
VRFWILFFLLPLQLFSQADTDFQIKPSACLEENLKILSSLPDVASFEWDFCQGDLLRTPALTTKTENAFNIPIGTSLIESNGMWYGFICSFSNELFRLDFGTSLLNSNPIVTNLGNISNLLSSPQDIKVIEYQSSFYAFVNNRGSNKIVRVDLGNNIENNNPTALTIVGGNGFENGGIDLNFDGSNWVLAITNNFNLTLVNLGSSPLSTPSNSDVLNSSSFLGADGIGDIKLVKEGSNWYGFIVAFNSRSIHRLSFGDQLYSNPQSEIIPSPELQSFVPVGLVLEKDNGNWILLACTTLGVFQRFNFGSSLLNDSPVYSNLGDLGGASNTLKMDVANSNSRWMALTSNWNSKNYYLITFPQASSGFSQEFNSTDPNPIIQAKLSGEYAITLTSRSPNGLIEKSHHKVVVGINQSPTVDFISSSLCFNTDAIFTASSNGVLADFSWDLASYGSSTEVNPSIYFNDHNDFLASLSVTAENGCNNYVEKTISIYDEPIPDFQIPVTNPLCTNQNYIFENTSATDSGYPVTWQWKVNSVDQAVTEDLNYIFTQADNQSVTLTASIPGCENTITKPISTLTEGPMVDFSVPTIRCEDDALQFTNATQGSVTGYTWNFGDGDSSADINTSHVYATSGSYPLTLAATNAAGCVNFNTRSIQVYSKPVVDFTTINPCNGQATLFNDNTAPLTDSNVAFWEWNFGDNSSASYLKNTQHIFAEALDYNVSLAVTTSAGCSSITEKTITIKPTPLPDFTYTPACVGKEITFTGTSTGTITYWDWQAGGSSSGAAALQEIKRTIGTSGASPVTLTVTGANGCFGQVVKQLIIPPALMPNFSVLKNCVNQETEFTDITNDAVDPIESYLWEVPGGLTSTSSPAVFSFPSTASRNIKLTVTTETGCVYEVTKPVTVFAGPQASFTVSREAGGPPLEVAFTNTSSNATSFYWEFGDAAQTTSTAGSPVFTYTELGEYEAELTAYSSQQCISTASKIITVVIPVIDVMLTNLELQQLVGGSIKPRVTIVNHSNVPLTNVSLLLDVAGVTVREFVNTSIPAGGSLQHTVRFELPGSQGVDYFCAEAEVEDISVLDNKVCLNLENTLTLLSPYPNPATDIISLEWISNDESNVTVTLVNAMGREVKKYEVQSQRGFNPLVIDTAGMSSGVYLVRIQHKGLSKVYRVVIL